MKVFKFGGASIKDAERIKNVVHIVENEKLSAGIIVISAIGKMTNAFEEVVDAYQENKGNLEDKLKYITEAHQVIIDELFDDKTTIQKDFNLLITELKKLLTQENTRNYDFNYDQIVCFGEFISSTIISNYMRSCRLQNKLLDVRKLIITNSDHRDASVDWETTSKRILGDVNKNELNIVQGFLGGDLKGNTTTLGREGSDYTAGIFAHCLEAENVTIWKDVVGVLNADPREFSDATLIEEISYEETIEMAFYGASVIHPKTIQPLQAKEIPLYVKSFLDFKKQGTKVCRGTLLKPLMPCYIVKKGQVLVSISSKDFSFIVEENISEIFKLLHEYQLKVNLIQNTAISFTICIDNKFERFSEFLENIDKKFKVSFTESVDLYTIRHFDDTSLNKIYSLGKALLTQINKETAQVVLIK